MSYIADSEGTPDVFKAAVIKLRAKGQLDEKILAALGTVLGALITALTTRGKKDGDNDGTHP